MALTFKQDLSANYGVAEQLSPLITRVLCNNPSPYTYTGTATYIVGTDRGLAVIDPGPMHEAHLSAILNAIGNRTVSHILVTHSHIDHSPLSHRLADATNAPISAFGPHGAGRKGGLEGEAVEAGADWDFRPDHTLQDGETLTGANWTLKAIHTPGHTANHMCFLLEEENTLFVGDHIMAWATTVISPPDGDVRDYIESLRKVAALKPDTLVPTHGPWVKNAVPFIRGIITHRKMREGQILKHLNAGAQTIRELVSIMYKDVDKRLHGAAARSVFGHLIALVDEKRVTTDGPARLESNYGLPNEL
jgi:glyoxylase-like metal-dependent hydrolase (beta-lactamase superfamily II)